MLELIVVIIIMGVLSLVAIRGFSSQTAIRQYEETIIEMEALKKAIVGDPDRIQDGIRVDYGYVGDMGSVPSGSVPSGSGDIGLRKLLTNQGGGWNGPYIAVNFSDNDEDYLFDAFGQPYGYDPTGLTISSPALGANVTLTIASDINDLTNNTITLLIQDVNGNPLPADTANFVITLSLQTQVDVTGPVVPASGFVQLTGIPMGNHTLVVTYPGLASVIKRVSVDPSFTLAPINIIFTFP